MEWLNLSVSILNSAPLRRATVAQRGVWLSLMSYCVQQENSGQIAGTEHWTDWDWLQVIGVQKKDAQGDCTLWRWEDGDVMTVLFYPTEKERQVRRNRKSGKAGGSRVSAAKSQAARLNGAHRSTTQALTQAKPNQNPSNNPTEGEGEGERKDKEKEKGKRQRAVARPVRPTLQTWLDEAHTRHPSWPEDDAHDAWSHYEACGWMMARGKPVRSWPACVTNCFKRWHGRGQKSSLEKIGGGFDPARPHAHTGGLPLLEPVQGGGADPEGAPC